MGRRASKSGIEAIRRAMKRNGWKQTEIAEEVGFARSTLNQILSGQAVRSDNLEELCHLLELEVGQVLEPEDEGEDKTLDSIVQEVRLQECPKLIAEYGTIQLPLTRQRVEVNDLYVDVYVLTRLTSDYRATIQDLWRTYDWQTDRAGLGNRVDREDGETLVKQAKYRRAVVLGKPGSGKSTFMQRLVVGCIRGKLFADHIPVLVLLRKIATGTFHIKQYLQQEWNILETDLESILKSGQVLLLLDGLDEVPGQFQSRIKQEIEEFSRNYHQVCIIVTCRTQTVEYALGAFRFLEIADFNPEQVRQFAHNWFTADDVATANDQTKQFMDALDAHPAIAELAITPILLGLSCLLWRDQGDLPVRRGELYEQGIELLLREWDERREIHRDCESETYHQLSTDQRQDLLSYIAFKKFHAPDNFVLFTQEELQRRISYYLSVNKSESLIILKIIEEHHGLLIRRAEKVYSFSHLTFQEYFVARELTQLEDETLLAQITDQKWQEAFRLAISRIKDPSDLLWRTKKQIDQLLADDDKLQDFLQWVAEKANLMTVPYKLAAIRAFYFALDFTNLAFALALDLTRNLDRVLDLDLDHNFSLGFLARALDRDLYHAQTFDLDLACALGPALARDHDRDRARARDLDLDRARARDLDRTRYLARDHDRDLAIDLAIDLDLSCAPARAFARALALDRTLVFNLDFVKQSDPRFYLKLHQLNDELPNRDATWVIQKQWIREQGATWITKLRTLMIEHRNIGHDWRFSDAQKEKLQQYYDANKVLVELLKSENVSKELRQAIEGSMLLPLSQLDSEGSLSAI